MRVVTFKIDESLLERLDVACVRKGISRSDAIRAAIIEWLKREGQNVRPRFITIKRVVIA